MQIKSTRKFSSGDLGHVVPGRVLTVSEERGKYLISIGVAESLEIKPAPLDLEVKPAPSSQPARVRQGITSASFQREASTVSQSMTPSDSSLTPDTSTQQTCDGGESTTPKSGKVTPARAGRKTRKRRASTDSTE